MSKTIAACAALFAAIPLAAACGGSSEESFPFVTQSESEVAKVLVDVGLTCKDSETEFTPAEGMRVTRWDCVNKGSEHPYFDVFYLSGEALQDDTLGVFCDYAATDPFNDGVLQLNGVNFTMASNAAVEVNATLTDMEVANVNAAIEEPLKAVGKALGLTPQTPSQLCA